MNEDRIIKYYSKKTSLMVPLKVIEGHFATPNSHISHYLDVKTMKTRVNEAEQIAATMKDYYNYLGKPIDTIVCFNGMEVVGAFLAQQLTSAGVLSTNAHKTIYVVSPEFDMNGQQFFRDNLKSEIKNKNILLLYSSISTGRSVRNGIECINYYGGYVQGVSSIFSTIDSIDGIHIDTLFTPSDIPNYHTYSSHECPMCKSGQRIEALVNGHGYSLL